MLIFNFYVPPEEGQGPKRPAFKRWISQEFIFGFSYLHMLNVLMKTPASSGSSTWLGAVCLAAILYFQYILTFSYCAHKKNVRMNILLEQDV